MNIYLIFARSASAVRYTIKTAAHHVLVVDSIAYCVSWGSLYFQLCHVSFIWLSPPGTVRVEISYNGTHLFHILAHV